MARPLADAWSAGIGQHHGGGFGEGLFDHGHDFGAGDLGFGRDRVGDKLAAGQAEDYAKTNAGRLLVSQVKVGEAMEKLGAVVLPLVVGAMEVAAELGLDGDLSPSG